MKKHVIITSSNKKYGNFLVIHWFRSLQENVNLKNIDVIVLDYGLTNDQKQYLKKNGVVVLLCKKVGHVVVSRFIDSERVLTKSSYDQVLFCDGGDIIFQKDISPLFERNKDCFRAGILEEEVLFNEVFIPGNFSKEKSKEISNYLKNKPILNAGFILAPKQKFINICRLIDKLITNKNVYGPDQVALNYAIYKEGVKIFDRKFNFMPSTVKAGLFIKEGIIYQKNAGKIAIIHNAGHNGFMRPIWNFGYGKGFNRLNYPMYYGKRVCFKFLALVKKLFMRLQ